MARPGTPGRGYRPPAPNGGNGGGWLLIGGLVAALVLVVALGSVALGFATGGGSASPTPRDAAVASPSSSGQAAASAASASPAASATAMASPDASSAANEPDASVDPAPVPSQSGGGALGDVAIVPVTHFRTTLESTTVKETAAALAGTSKTFAGLELVESEADAVLAALGLERPPAAGKTLVLAKDADALAADLAAHRDRLAFLRADDIGPSVRALAWGSARLFGVDAVTSADAWPLHATLPLAAQPFDPAATWTIVAGGDIMLDRGVNLAVRVRKKGVDFPFDGGTVDVTSRYCCSSMGWDLPKTKKTGNAGAVRSLLQDADLAIANFENPAPDAWRYHTTGTVFSAEPAKIQGLADAGIDWVSLANNHIRDAGANGILQTRKNLAKYGLAFGGAGKDINEARAPSYLEVGGQKVAILAYDTIAPSYWATSSKVGSAHMTAAAVKADVARARAAGADVVIVFPHWGVEYKNTATKLQRDLAHAAIDAGADMVIGSHSHWAGAMEVYEGKPIWYSLGNFVFDQTWSEQTMEGLLLELTFNGDHLVQARLQPHLILDRAQPNLLDGTDAKVVLDRTWKGSGKLLPW
jgi:hypothetical protein